MLPFSHDAFLAVFGAYNQAIWPAQVLAYAGGLGIAGLTRVRRAWADRAALALLSAMWLWTGAVYHLIFFARINPAAILFGALFLAQGVLLLHAAARRTLRFGPAGRVRAALGWGLIGYAMAVYPLIGLWSGQRWPDMPIFGVAPCPLVLFSFGVLALAAGRPPVLLSAAPVLWSLIGGSAALLLGVPQDWALLLGGVLTWLVVWRNGKAAR